MANYFYCTWPTPTESDPNATEDRLIRYGANNRDSRLATAKALWRQNAGAELREFVNVNSTVVKAAVTAPVWGGMDLATCLKMVNRLRSMGEAWADDLANTIQAAIDAATV